MLKAYYQKSQKKPTYLRIKVTPKSPKTEFIGITSDETHGDTIKIRLKAAPEKGKANQELIKYLSQELEVHSSDISIISGETERTKLIKIK